jgi:long-chain acyl-CoA synthetase
MASIYPDPEQVEDSPPTRSRRTLQSEIDRINDGLPVLHQQINMLNIREQEFERTSSKKIKRHLVYRVRNRI